MSSTSPAPTEAAPRRRLIAVPRPALWAAAGIVVVGALLAWLRPLQPVSVGVGGASSVPVIGAPGTSFPTAAARPGQPGAGHTITRVPAPAFSLIVLSPGQAPRHTAATAGASSSTSRAAPQAVIPPAGARLALAALRGHPVVINFWASWCAPCRAEMPMLVKAAHTYAARGVVVLGLDVDDPPADARRFLAQYRVDYPIVTVPDDRLPRAYGLIGLPTTVFIDASGTIRARQVGQFDGADGERTLARDLETLVAGGTR
jgi:cytochrome c biogenesis protein CcmG, thiol:disulfide interchange protein DsbE